MVTTEVDRLKVERLKEKASAITQSQNRLDLPAATRAAQVGASTGDYVMDDHYCPSAFSLNT